jgi:hypothetical protein
MTSSLPQDVRDVFDSFLTTEYTTIDARQQPIVWPVTPYYDQGAATIDITTGIGYPKKAYDARRNPHVALLFSDPTGSKLTAPPAVLVQGTAEVDDADLEKNRLRYRSEAVVKLPATKDMLPPKFLEGLFSWYFERIYVKVRPERVFVWKGGDFTTEPEIHGTHLEEVRSGHTEEPAEPREPGAGGERMDELGSRYETAVLSWVAPDGFPVAGRVPISLDHSSRQVKLGTEPAGLPMEPGLGCLTAHSHGEEFEWQENFQVRGDLVRGEDGWALVPHKFIGGFELPKESELARYRRNFRKSVRFYRTRKEYLKAKA